MYIMPPRNTRTKGAVLPSGKGCKTVRPPKEKATQPKHGATWPRDGAFERSKVTGASIPILIETLQGLDENPQVCDERLWINIVEKAVVNSRDDIVVTFHGGIEVKVSLEE